MVDGGFSASLRWASQPGRWAHPVGTRGSLQALLLAGAGQLTWLGDARGIWLIWLGDGGGIFIGLV